MHTHSATTDQDSVLYTAADGPDEYGGAVVPPIYTNTLFVYPTYESMIAGLKDEQHHYVYMRGTNPTVEIVEKKLAALEEGESCKCFASGMGAIAAALLHCLRSGDHVLCVSNIYYSTMKLLAYMRKFGVQHSVVYSTAAEHIERAIRPETKVILAESPTSMTLRVVDLEAVAALAKQRNIRTIVDNTWATPLYQKPLRHGVDIVVHAASKYLGGHSDMLGGAVVSNTATIAKLFQDEYLLFGGVMGPHEANVLLRGLRSLPLRLKAHQDNALQVARFLESHPAVAKVNYPALPSHPDYELGKRQLAGYTGLMSFELQEATFPAVKRVLNRLRLFRIGVSWGSFESLALGANIGTNERQLAEEGISPGLIRISVGLEEAALQIKDLANALE